MQHLYQYTVQQNSNIICSISVNILLNRTPISYTASLSKYCSREHQLHIQHLYEYTFQQNYNIISSIYINKLFNKTQYYMQHLYQYTVQQNTNIICSISINTLFNRTPTSYSTSLSMYCSTEHQ